MRPGEEIGSKTGGAECRKCGQKCRYAHQKHGPEQESTGETKGPASKTVEQTKADRGGGATKGAPKQAEKHADPQGDQKKG